MALMNLFNWRVIKKYANIIFMVLVFVVGLSTASYILAYKPYSIRQDKERFTKAEASLDKVYNQILAKVGKPDQVKKYQNCDRPNQKSGQGPLSCDVGFYIIFSDKNNVISTEIMKNIASIYTEPLRESLGHQISDFLPKDSKKGSQVFYQNSSDIAGFKCSFGYTYPAYPPSSDAVFRPTSEENIVIDYSCGGPAKARHYPMRD